MHSENKLHGGHILEEVFELLFFLSGPPSMGVVVGAGHLSSSHSAEFLLSIRVNANGSVLLVLSALGLESRLVLAELVFGVSDLLTSDISSFTPPGILWVGTEILVPFWMVSVGAAHLVVSESAEFFVTIGVNADGSSLVVNVAVSVLVVTVSADEVSSGIWFTADDRFGVPLLSCGHLHDCWCFVPPLFMVSVRAGHLSVSHSAEFLVTIRVCADGSSLSVNLADSVPSITVSADELSS